MKETGALQCLVKRANSGGDTVHPHLDDMRPEQV